MNFNIFVNNDGIIEINNVNINAINFKKIQSDIDTWNGKGDILTQTCSMFELLEKYDLQKTKIDIISSKVIGKDNIYLNKLLYIENVDIYELEYYAYEPCELSILCNNILDTNKTIIKRSINLNKLLNWSSNNPDELLFVKLLLKNITINPLNSNVLSNDKLIDFLERLTTILKSYKLYNSELDKLMIRNNNTKSRAKTKKMISTSIPNNNNIRKICQ